MPLKLKDAPTPRRSLGRMTYEQFLQWDGENQHVEWVDGEVIEMPPVSGAHSDLNVFLMKVVDEYVGLRQLGKVRCNPSPSATSRA